MQKYISTLNTYVVKKGFHFRFDFIQILTWAYLNVIMFLFDLFLSYFFILLYLNLFNLSDTSDVHM